MLNPQLSHILTPPYITSFYFHFLLSKCHSLHLRPLISTVLKGDHSNLLIPQLSHIITSLDLHFLLSKCPSFPLFPLISPLSFSVLSFQHFSRVRILNLLNAQLSHILTPPSITSFYLHFYLSNCHSPPLSPLTSPLLSPNHSQLTLILKNDMTSILAQSPIAFVLPFFSSTHLSLFSPISSHY